MAGEPEGGLNEAPHFHGHRDRLRARFRTMLTVLIVLGVVAAYALLFWLRLAKAI